MRIGELASRAGVPVSTVRYYERRGLLREPPRYSSGYRDYPRSAVERLRAIKHAQNLGFTLREARELIELQFEDEAPCERAKSRAQEKLQRVRHKIRDLTHLEERLGRLVQSCEDRPTAEGCPILERIEEE